MFACVSLGKLTPHIDAQMWGMETKDEFGRSDPIALAVGSEEGSWLRLNYLRVQHLQGAILTGLFSPGVSTGVPSCYSRSLGLCYG